jgi:hypothetical protein
MEVVGNRGDEVLIGRSGGAWDLEWVQTSPGDWKDAAPLQRMCFAATLPVLITDYSHTFSLAPPPVLQCCFFPSPYCLVGFRLPAPILGLSPPLHVPVDLSRSLRHSHFRSLAVLGSYAQLVVIDCRPHMTSLEEDEVGCCQVSTVGEIDPARELTVGRTAVAREVVEVPLTSWVAVACYEDMASPNLEMVRREM